MKIVAIEAYPLVLPIKEVYGGAAGFLAVCALPVGGGADLLLLQHRPNRVLEEIHIGFAQLIGGPAERIDQGSGLGTLPAHEDRESKNERQQE